MIYYALVRPKGCEPRSERLIFENWKLEIKENYNSYTRSMAARPSKRGNEILAKRIRAHDGCLGIRRR